jgi:phage tail-like protein
MADPARETVQHPFTAFNFKVELEIPDLPNPLCSAAFSECDGLEMTMEPKTIREGGNNNQQIHLIGPISYGQLTLKRGMTDTLDLWDWFEQVLQQGQGGLRASGDVVMFAADGNTEQVRFTLTNCLPVKLKAPALNAKDGVVAIEEMQIAYERMRIKRPGT